MFSETGRTSLCEINLNILFFTNGKVAHLIYDPQLNSLQKDVQHFLSLFFLVRIISADAYRPI